MQKFSDKPCKICGEAFSPTSSRSFYCAACRSRCLVAGCQQPMYSQGYCSTHLTRVRHHGDAGPAHRLRQWQTGLCSVEGCERKAEKKGLCELHYMRVRNTGEPGTALPQGKPRGAPCEVEGCTRLSDADGLCNMHYCRRATKGDVGPAHAIQGERGKGHNSKKGYRIIVVNGRPIREHRYVMEQMLGRPLTPDESPHHRSGDRSDNSPANLELWSKKQPAGQRVADKVKWAVELLKTYPEFATSLGYRLIALESLSSTEMLSESEVFDASDIIRGSLSM